MLTPISRIAVRANYGPMDFWNDIGDFMRDLRLNGGGRDWLEYEEWRVFFKRAYKAGLLDVHAGAWERGKVDFGSLFGRAIMRTYQAVKSARQRGLSAEQFHREFCAQIDHDSDVGKRAFELSNENRREAREKAENERRRGNGRRRRDDPDDDREISEVRVGYQPAAQPALIGAGKE